MVQSHSTTTPARRHPRPKRRGDDWDTDGEAKGKADVALSPELKLLAVRCRCTDKLRRYADLQRLAALVKGLPTLPDEDAVGALLDEWARRSPGSPQTPHWRRSLRGLFSTFLDRVAHDGGGKFGEAVRRAKHRPPLPCEEKLADDEQAAFAVRLLAELDALVQGRPFPLGVRALQTALAEATGGASKRDAVRVLGRLQAESVIEMTKEAPRGPRSRQAREWLFLAERGDAWEPSGVSEDAMSFPFGALATSDAEQVFFSSPSSPCTAEVAA